MPAFNTVRLVEVRPYQGIVHVIETPPKRRHRKHCQVHQPKRHAIVVVERASSETLTRLNVPPGFPVLRAVL